MIKGDYYYKEELFKKIKIIVTYMLQGVGIAIPIAIIIKLITQPKEAIMICVGVTLYLAGKYIRHKIIK